MSAATALHTPAEQQLVSTVGGQKLHLPECPHLLRVPVVAAAPEDLATLAVCHWCRQELDGVGRTYFDTLEEAMRFFGTHAGTETAIRDAVRFIQRDQIWVPYSKAYIALGREGAGVAWIGKTYVATRDLFVELPDYRPGGGGGAARPVPEPSFCEVCFLQLPVAGTCDCR